MRLDEDKMVSHGCSGVDLILGGHDHDIVVYGHGVTVLDDNAMGDIKIIKSGTDFRSYSIISLNVTKQNGQTLIKKVQCKCLRATLLI
jgi:5'-nucleotidase